MPSVIHIFLACAAPSAFWLLYWSWRSHLAPGRRRVMPVLAFFASGVLSGPLALALFEFVELSPFYERLAMIDGTTEVEKFAFAVFAIGPVEELAKFLVAWACLRALKDEADASVGGILYSAAAALGFATVENWYYMLQIDEVVWHRALTLPFNHVLFSSFWGVGLTLYQIRRTHGGLWLAASLILSIVYHGLYNFILLSNEIPGYYVIPLVLTLWIWLVVAIPRLRRGVRRAEDRGQTD